MFVEVSVELMSEELMSEELMSVELMSVEQMSVEQMSVEQNVCSTNGLWMRSNYSKLFSFQMDSMSRAGPLNNLTLVNKGLTCKIPDHIDQCSKDIWVQNWRLGAVG